jgi:endonuclease YncB( thermonuclease family)
LYGIDCPEKKQPFGNTAKQFTSELVYGKLVEVEPVATDRYGRTVALVWVGNILLNEALIRAGLARVYSRYCRLADCASWAGIQIKVRTKKEGLWQDVNSVPPWEFRKQKKQMTAKY